MVYSIRIPLSNSYYAGVGIDGSSDGEIVLVKKPGKIQALEDEINQQFETLNFDRIHENHVGISHTR